jgi:endonuclease G
VDRSPQAGDGEAACRSHLGKLNEANARDPRIDNAYDAAVHTADELYADNRLDRGHIARRADLLWGPRAQGQQANTDSFFFTNITPQLNDFNQSFLHGLWGELEDAIYEQTDVDDLRLTLFGGPFFKATDHPYRGRLIPRSYWKLIAYAENTALKAKAFVLT